MVSGTTGPPNVNGDYYADGTSDGVTAYKHASQSYYLWRGDPDGPAPLRWNLSAGIDVGPTAFYHSSLGDTPPTGVWTTGTGSGTATVSEGA